MTNQQRATDQAPGKRSVDVTGLSEDAMRALEVLVSELRGQRLAELRREIGVGIEQVDKGQVAPLNARETLMRVGADRKKETENGATEEKVVAMLLEGLQQLDRGEGIDGEAFLEERRREEGGMKNRVTVSPEAARDVIEQAKRIEEDNPDLARRFCAAVEKATLMLMTNPEPDTEVVRDCGRPELSGLRMWRMRGYFAKYLIIFRPIDHGIEIVQVLLASQEIEAAHLGKLL